MGVSGRRCSRFASLGGYCVIACQAALNNNIRLSALRVRPLSAPLPDALKAASARADRAKWLAATWRSLSQRALFRCEARARRFRSPGARFFPSPASRHNMRAADSRRRQNLSGGCPLAVNPSWPEKQPARVSARARPPADDAFPGAFTRQRRSRPPATNPALRNSGLEAS